MWYNVNYENCLSDSLIKTAETKGEKRGIAIGEKRGDERGIRNLIKSLREVSVSDQIIIDKLQQKYSLTLAEAQLYLNS